MSQVETQIKVKVLPEGKEVNLPAGKNGADLAKEVSQDIYRKAVGIMLNGELRDPKKVAHMLLYVGNGTIVELNASNVSPEQWRASAYPETTYLQRDFATKRKSLFACPVSAVPAQLQSTLAEIVLAYPGERLLAPKQIDTEVTNEHRAYGFLPFVQRGQL